MSDSDPSFGLPWTPGHSTTPWFWIPVSLICLALGTGTAPFSLRSQSSQLIHAPGHTPLAFLGQCPKHGALERADRTSPAPLMATLLGLPRNDFGLCQGQGAFLQPPGPQDPAVGGQQLCNGRLFSAPACSLLPISRPCDPGNALLPRATTPRLESLSAPAGALPLPPRVRLGCTERPRQPRPAPA